MWRMEESYWNGKPTAAVMTALKYSYLYGHCAIEARRHPKLLGRLQGREDVLVVTYTLNLRGDNYLAFS